MSLVLENVTYRYSQGTAYEITALNHVNLSIGDGEFIGVIGHTGSGKSTLVQHLNGLLRATEGAIYFSGENIYQEKYDLRSLRTQVGMVFQYPEHQLFEATEALKSVGLDESCYGKSPFELSGGQKRRAAIAGVIAMKPSVLILDEPTAGLDPRGRDEILDLVADMHKNYGCTVILVSHSMEDVANYVDRIVVMNDGEVLYDDTPRQVFRHYKKLEEIGLAAPQVTYLMHELKEEGFPVDCDATTIEEAKAEILKLC